MIGVARSLALLAALVGVGAIAGPATGAPRVETFGPGTVDCQQLVGDHFDCLLSTPRVTEDNRNEATFDIAALPPDEQAIFRNWCSIAADGCIVTITGIREAPDTSRLSTVTSIQWTRHSPPMNQAAARAN